MFFFLLISYLPATHIILHSLSLLYSEWASLLRLRSTYDLLDCQRMLLSTSFRIPSQSFVVSDLPSSQLCDITKLWHNAFTFNFKADDGVYIKKKKKTGKDPILIPAVFHSTRRLTIYSPLSTPLYSTGTPVSTLITHVFSFSNIK